MANLVSVATAQVVEFIPSSPKFDLEKLHVVLDDGRAWYRLDEIMSGLTLISLDDTLNRLHPEALRQVAGVWYIEHGWLNTALTLARNPKAYKFNAWILQEVKPMVTKMLAEPAPVKTAALPATKPAPINKISDVLKKFGITTTKFYRVLKKNNLTTDDLRDKSGNFTDAGLTRLETLLHSKPEPITAAFKDEPALPQVVSENPVLEFASEQFGKVRVLERDGEPWFVAADVCDLFEVTNRNRVMQEIDDDEKGGTQLSTPGGIQKFTIISESGLYTLLFALQPRKARGVSNEEVERRWEKLHQFKRWVTHDVLPSIRKRGMYATPMTARQMIESPDFARTVLEALIAEQEKNAALQQKIEADAPKVLFSDTVEDRGQYVGLGTFAKMLYNDETHVGRQKLIRWLRSNNYFIQKAPLPYQEYINKGWFFVKTKIISTGEAIPVTLITPKGQIALTTAFKRSH